MYSTVIFFFAEFFMLIKFFQSKVYGHEVKTLSQASLIIDFPVRIKPKCDALF